MRLLEFFNEAQEIELRSPGTLQKVLDAFLSFTAQSDQLPPEVRDAEALCAALRSRLDQSKEAGGESPGQYGKLALSADEMEAVALALKTVGTPQDAMKLRDDLRGMRMEGLSANGAEGLGGHGEGFEVQNQGVVRRSPGEGPKANGGRTQPQQFDSYDQPQYENFKGVRDADSIETQDMRVGSQEVGSVPMREIFKGDPKWEELYGGKQFVLKTEFGEWSVHQAQGKWVHVFYPNEGMQVPYEDGYAPTPGHAMQEAEKQYEKMKRDPPVDMGVGYDPGEMWGQFPVPKRKPLMNSRDRGAEQEYDEHGKSMAKLGLDKKSSHKLARAIATDHRKEDPEYYKKDEAVDTSKMKAAIASMERYTDPTGMKDVQHRMKRIAKKKPKNEGVRRLAEFYALDEEICVISPEANGIGNLRSADEPEPIAAGGIDDLLQVFFDREPAAQQLGDVLRSAFEKAIEDDAEVVFDPDDLTVRLVPKEDKEEED